MTEYTYAKMDSRLQACPMTLTDTPRQGGLESNAEGLIARGEDEHGPYTDTFNYPTPGAPTARA